MPSRSVAPVTADSRWRIASRSGAQVTRRVRVERLVLALHRAALAGERPAGEALGEQAPGSRLPGRLDQVVGALAPQPVGELEVARHLPGVEPVGDRGELVDHGLGLGGAHRRHDRLAVEGVGHGRLGAQRPDRVLLLRRARERRDGVPGAPERGDQPGRPPLRCRLRGRPSAD